MNFLVYQAYGHIEILHEALYSILSYLRVSGHLPEEEQAQIVVYTDNEALFTTYLQNLKKPIQYRPMPAEQIADWRLRLDAAGIDVAVRLDRDFGSLIAIL